MDNHDVVGAEESPQMQFDEFIENPIDDKNMEGNFVEQINQQIDNVTNPGSGANSHQDENEVDPFDLDNDEDDIDLESVRALTLKDGVDYENDQQNFFIPDFEPPQNQYPPGYQKKDDLNKDGKIDQVESALKIGARKDEIKNEIDDKIRDDYLQKFRKEVDFHHKVAYRFEKSYRLSKKHPEKREALNEEIVEIISEHSNYIE